MKAVILAAGYARRLYPLTAEQPKPLLPVGGRPILSHIAGHLKRSGLNELIVVTNERFYDHFVRWASRETGLHCRILNDGTTDNETRLGAIGDIRFAVREEKLSEPVLIVAGDNLFDFEISGFIRFFESKGTSVACYDLGNPETAGRYGVVGLDARGRVVNFLEKPANPPSSLISTGIYGYTPSDLELLDVYMAENSNTDAPGHFVGWLCGRKAVYGYVISGRWFDIGDLESYRLADERFSNPLPGKE